MRTKTRDWKKDPALYPTALAAIELALQGASSPEVATRLIAQILSMTYRPNDDQSIEGASLLLDAARALDLAVVAA